MLQERVYFWWEGNVLVIYNIPYFFTKMFENTSKSFIKLYIYIFIFFFPHNFRYEEEKFTFDVRMLAKKNNQSTKNKSLLKTVSVDQLLEKRKCKINKKSKLLTRSN
eukprot:TRINITY_DN13543_c0_g1_i13.p1 TRINITY_DN13543_c0_g1~~TRINITY_DN13543_c0_g1_i13.p1  ORF type:complete len:107 (-),score=3.92 TRINITY_DN13543_c0_g1_i13:112-432(-)